MRFKLLKSVWLMIKIIFGSMIKKIESLEKYIIGAFVGTLISSIYWVSVLIYGDFIGFWC